MRICVLSDVHYKYAPRDSYDRANASLALDFLKQAVGKYDLMVLNGDIFDLWFDWTFTIIKQYFPFLHRLAEIREHGCRLVLISGNHDFWFNDFFRDYLDVKVYNDAYSLKADGIKMLFTHGDLHTVNDFRYKFFRRLIRFRLSKKLFSLLHPDLALRLGAKLSRSSRFRQVSALLQSKKSAGLSHYAEYMVKKKDYDLVCMGHCHRPGISQLKGGTYANSGDWTRHHSYLEIDAGRVNLKYYKSKETQHAQNPSEDSPCGDGPGPQPQPAELPDQ
ncbi:MAG: UDP-2,3-diacylglucosamine diphosphatase [Candidatus Cloacimonetes bacterium]|nr:UDP-2,3-diacylglucosamine diphosphatase [Candidatus Cloacimonadota bacterium]MDY0366293.1 UDP-2,3-diacylglucosamine diphosphatase [Candidatus Syntrophosphaera sp.]